MASTGSIAGGIHFTGLGNGTDFDTMITQLVDVERIHTKRLTLWRKEWEDKSKEFQNLNTKLLTLKTTLEGLDTPGEFLAKDTVVTNESVLTATAGANAQNDSFSVYVNQLAQNAILTSSNAFASSTTVVNTGAAQFNFTYGGVTYSNAVPAGTTLSGLAAIINANPGSRSKVRASILKVSDTQSFLQITGLDQGAAYSLSINGSTLSNFGNAQFATTQASQDAQLQVNGYPAGPPWITRSSNSINDVVAGITLNLKGQGPATVDVSTNTTKVKESVQTFVDQMNEVRKQIKVLTEVSTVNAKSPQGSILTGNYGVEIIDSKLKSIIASKGVGFDYDQDRFSALSQIGIKTDATQGSATYGLLTIDMDALDKALASNASAVASVFSADYDGATDSAAFSYMGRVNGTTEAGEYDVNYTVSNGTVTGATINGNAATYDPNTRQITAAVGGQPEYGLSLLINNLTDGSYSGKVRLKIGKSGELVDSLKDLTSATDGPLKILQDNYADIMEDIDKKIDYEDSRIARMERDLRNRFSKLESLLGYYDNLQKSLTSQINSMGSSSK